MACDRQELAVGRGSRSWVSSICQRYIELNPVRADMVKDLALYRWTSYRANALGYEDASITPHALYLSLGQDTEARRHAYGALFRSGLDTEAITDIWLAVSQNQPLGNERFLTKIEEMTGIRREAKVRGRPRMTSRIDDTASEIQSELALKEIREPSPFTHIYSGCTAKGSGISSGGTFGREGISSPRSGGTRP